MLFIMQAFEAQTYDITDLGQVRDSWSFIGLRLGADLTRDYRIRMDSLYGPHQRERDYY
jgi:hypothetical protein